MSDIICLFCNKSYSKKVSLNKHLINCKATILCNPLEIQKFIINYTQRAVNISKDIEQNVEEPLKEITLDVEPDHLLVFDGIFSGREKEIRITPDKQISVFDFIKVVGGQTQPDKTWKNILKEHEKEVRNYFTNFKFLGQGQRLTPVINVQGMVKLLFWLPGETAKQFRSKSAEVMIRYLGGDTTLIDEIKAIDQEHIDNPNNIAQVFREQVTERQLFNQDQINTSKRLINYYGDKRDILYVFIQVFRRMVC
jgi:hypothetical protein